MHSKLAGLNLPLQDMIANVIESSRAKVAAAEEKEKEEKKSPFSKKEEKKEEEKKKESSSIIDFQDAGEVEKLASALDYMADLLIKEADSIENGGEKKQGGTQLATQSPTGGKQTYTGNKAKHQIPAPTTKGTVDNPGVSNAMATDDSRAPGGNGAKYPAKGVLKTAGQSVMDKISAAKGETELDRSRRWGRNGAMIGGGFSAASHLAQGLPLGVGGAAVGAGLGAGMGYGIGRLSHRLGHGPASPTKKAKTSSVEAVDFILDKLAEVNNGGEKKQGGEQLSNTAPVPSNPGRKLISSNSAPASATKREAKSPRIGELKQVLTEPAMTSSTDNTVQQNLRNASKGGVKIAAVKALLSKIASDPSDPRYGALMEAAKQKVASKSKKGTLGGMAPAASSGPSLPATTPGM